MTGRKILPFFAILFVCCSFSCTPDQPDFPEGRAEADLRFLADDLLEGRGTPSKGLDVAALYLANQLRAAGWDPPPGGDYFQPYEVGIFDPAAAEISISLNGVALEAGQYAFMSMGLRPDETPVEYDLVFVGHGVSVPEEGADDFQGLDVEGKAAVALLGAPWELDPHVIHAPDHGIGKMVQTAVRGGQLLVYVSEEYSAGFEGTPGDEVGLINTYAHSPLTQLLENSRTSAFNIPVLVIGSDVFDQVLAGVAGGTYAELQDRIRGGESVRGDIAASVRIEIGAETRRGIAHNVLAVLPGSDRVLRDEWIVLTAHYDHLGAYDAPPGEDGIFNGADDNASGTAAVVEVARRLAAVGPLDRSVAVALVSGEEMGLIGSAVYAWHPPVPLEQTVLNINVDMVGRSDGTAQAVIPGSDELFAKAVEMGERVGMTVIPDQQPTWRLSYFTDSYHFAKNDIPAIFLFTSLHSDYHQPSDEIDKIEFEEFGKIVDVIGALARYYAEGNPLPAYERPVWFLTPRSRRY
jgi:hypothetical protein